MADISNYSLSSGVITEHTHKNNSPINHQIHKCMLLDSSTLILIHNPNLIQDAN